MTVVCRHRHRRWRAWTAAAALAVAWPAAALDSDKAQPVTLEADDFELDLESGARIYRGQVEYRQGSVRIDCDELVTRYDADDALQSGVCTGRPGRFQQTVDDGDGDGDGETTVTPETAATVVRGRALTITYDRAAGRIVLDGDAQVEHRGDRLRGARITYDLETRRARVTGGGDGERPRIEAQPRKASPN